MSGPDPREALVGSTLCLDFRVTIDRVAWPSPGRPPDAAMSLGALSEVLHRLALQARDAAQP